ncbi:DedA family protein [Kitasatospora kifunensis]|uniref:Membrane protein DedA with SNARE-associated domain n=1 Tax=Kitasatospora kifunensis TaxID=58351 RepID=A0A7W7R5D2_KITKI|nr:VTT domain-containing protein [Kitasatospora kifunensis]MBB4925534.1 membrane protein DedA with SNARE-associated domain [Kitasatospora kifunensis]
MGSAALLTSSWFCVLAVLAVLGDAFLPFLPSGTLVILAVLKTERIAGAPLILAGAVALSSFLGDVALLALARRGAPFLRRRLAKRPKLATSVRKVQHSLDGRTNRTAAAVVIVARFVPGGRTVLDLAIGHSPAPSHRFLRWSALAALVWAGYIVTLGWLNSHWFNTTWLSLAVSCAAATSISAAVARLVRRHRRLAAALPVDPA